MTDSRGGSAQPGSGQIQLTSGDADLVRQWIVYLIGNQSEGPLSSYVNVEEKSMFGAFTSSVSPSRSRTQASGVNTVLVSKTISSDVLRPLRLLGQEMEHILDTVTSTEMAERELTRRARLGEVVEDGPQREPTVDVEDLDAFLGSDGASSAVAAAPQDDFQPLTAQDVLGRVGSCPTIPPLPSDVGRSEADARQAIQLARQSARLAIEKAASTFIGLHNERVRRAKACKGQVVASPAVSDLLSMATAERLAGGIAARLASVVASSREEEEAFSARRGALIEVLAETAESITECDALSLKGALAVEMAKIEERLAEASALGRRAMMAARTRLDAMRPVLDGPTPREFSEEGAEGAALTSGGITAPEDDLPHLAPHSASASSSEPPVKEGKEVLAALTNTLKTQIDPFVQRMNDVFLQRVSCVAERQTETPDPGGPAESVVAYQQARRQQLLQQAEDLEAMARVAERQLSTMRGIYEGRDLPAAQQEHDRWSQYAKALSSLCDALQKNFSDRVKYDEEAMAMRSAQREKLPPPPPRMAVRLPEAPSDPRPEAAKGGLHHLPLTWRERYQRMPAAALLTAKPAPLRTPEEAAKATNDDEQAEREAEEASVNANVAADLIAECERLRQELRVTINKKRAREQCHVALVRQMGSLLVNAAVREGAAPDANGGGGATAQPTQAAAEARKALGEVLRRYS